MGGELLVAVLGVAGDADRADHLALRIADLQSAALGEIWSLVAPRQIACMKIGFSSARTFTSLEDAAHR